ncbi:MAG TPA: asparaginase [Ramlibacter sp.]|nr:asparaginase [Ramlibacter sp.]
MVLATGGTIAGAASTAHGNLGYTAAQIGIDELLAGVPALQGVERVTEQVSQIDSKDMSFGVWRTLALRCAHWLARPDVAGLVVTHGTDTAEETAFFLQHVLAPAKPVVIACAMRPATALSPDGPQNLVDALAVAASDGARGVVLVCAGVIHSALDVSKQHTFRVDPFVSGDAGPVGYVEEGQLRLAREWPVSAVLAIPQALAEDGAWPRVEIVMSHAGAEGRWVRALVKEGIDGLVVAATGNGMMHRDLEAALLEAQSRGVIVVRATRCTQGRVIGLPGDTLPVAASASPAKARIALMLELMGAPG